LQRCYGTEKNKKKLENKEERRETERKRRERDELEVV
jgi:hypothetical protein